MGETMVIRMYEDDDGIVDIVKVKELTMCAHEDQNQLTTKAIIEDRDFLALYILERGN